MFEKKRIRNFLISFGVAAGALLAGIRLTTGIFPETLLSVSVFLLTAAIAIFITLPQEAAGEKPGEEEKPVGVLSEIRLALRLFAIISVITVVLLHLKTGVFPLGLSRLLVLSLALGGFSVSLLQARVERLVRGEQR